MVLQFCSCASAGVSVVMCVGLQLSYCAFVGVIVDVCVFMFVGVGVKLCNCVNLGCWSEVVHLFLWF